MAVRRTRGQSGALMLDIGVYECWLRTYSTPRNRNAESPGVSVWQVTEMRPACTVIGK
jgi:hypothetical protein